MAKQREGFKKVEAGDIWKPKNINEEIEGRIVGIDKGKYGNEYTLQTKDKKKIQLPAHKGLVRRLANVEIGTYVLITYEGKGEAREGENAPELYDVQARED